MPIEEINRGLDSFRNTKDEDIENFLRYKVLEFEKRHWCTTYLLINVEQFKENRLKIEGFFTLSNKIFTITEDVAKSRKKKLFNGILRDDNCLHVILIGQLAKHIDNDYCGDTSMEELLDSAFEIIDDVNEKISCRCVLLECKAALSTDSDKEKENKQKLHNKYINYGFKAIQKDGELIQYIITTF